MKYIRPLLTSFLAIVLLGCNSTPEPTKKIESANVYLDHKFADNIQIETEDEIFYVTEEMRNFVKQRLMKHQDLGDRTKQLLRDLFDPEVLDIHYSHNANLTAQQVFDQGSANCLSLTILSYVLVKEARLAAQIMDVKVQENWTYDRGTSLFNGHVNLQVFEPNRTSRNLLLKDKEILTIDFLPMLNASIISRKALEKNEIVALFYNNKGAEAMVDSDYDRAYTYFKAATELGPNLSSTWGNLASLYGRLGYFEQAEGLYELSLQLDENNLNTRENLAVLYMKTDREKQAQRVKASIHRKRLNNPYYHAMLARIDFEEGNYQDSLRKYRTAVKLNRLEHSFLFGLAQNHLMLNELDKADYYLQRAKKIAASAHEKSIYQNKISALRQLTTKRM